MEKMKKIGCILLALPIKISMMRYLLFISLLCSQLFVLAQENTPYQLPDEKILALADVDLAPYVLMDNTKSTMVMLYRNQYKSIEELSAEELRLAGLRIDPKTNIGSRTTYFNNLKIKSISTPNAEPVQVEGLPKNAKLSNFTWSPNQKKIAFTHTQSQGVELWILDIESAKASILTGPVINANLRDVINWFPDNNSLLIKKIPVDKKELIDRKDEVPVGPTISTNEGKKAQNRTYQDLLKNPTDEFNFEQLAKSELVLLSIDGTENLWLPSNMYTNVSVSPNGKYVLVSTIEKPFSYLVPYSRFPQSTDVFGKDGKLVANIAKVPLTEDLPQGFMATRTGKRNINWRNDAPETIMYVEALDGGDPEVEVDFRDEVFLLNAPFKGSPTSILKTKNRFSTIYWGNSNLAVAYDYWWNNRNLKTYAFNPSKGNSSAKIIFDRNYQDRYADPGSFETTINAFGKSVLMLNNSKAYLIGDGFSEKGQFPFIDEFDLKTQKSKRIYQSNFTDKLENINAYDYKTNTMFVRIESPSEYPNYYVKNTLTNTQKQLTNFENPFKALQNVVKEVITYTREDGLELSGTLYLPVGYTKETAKNLPMILWAYPREFKDKASAAQNTKNPNEFTYLYWGSPLYWLTKGYVVLDDAAFPIVGEGENEPNDSFIKQLVADAKAGIDAVDNLGYINREKVAVGGHSYGAFMVANLLTHSDLFAAGIARSGAYNRTLTPFGFQSEERNYWEAPEIYYNMSPFMHADKMKHPLLLIHGEADNNSGTYPMQSERYFNALKGLGATVRLVMLPKESHGYTARESIMHMLYEQDQWLEKYLKN